MVGSRVGQSAGQEAWGSAAQRSAAKRHTASRAAAAAQVVWSNTVKAVEQRWLRGRHGAFAAAALAGASSGAARGSSSSSGQTEQTCARRILAEQLQLDVTEVGVQRDRLQVQPSKGARGERRRLAAAAAAEAPPRAAGGAGRFDVSRMICVAAGAMCWAAAQPLHSGSGASCTGAQFRCLRR